MVYSREKESDCTISMGTFGVVTRMIGGVSGSSQTFAVGEATQLPGRSRSVENLRTVMNILQETM
jgi:3-dehydroquinate dehydratase-1